MSGERERVRGDIESERGERVRGEIGSERGERE